MNTDDELPCSTAEMRAMASAVIQSNVEELNEVCLMNNLPPPEYIERKVADNNYICVVETRKMSATGVDLTALKAKERAANNLVIVLDDIYQYPNNRSVSKKGKQENKKKEDRNEKEKLKKPKKDEKSKEPKEPKEPNEAKEAKEPKKPKVVMPKLKAKKDQVKALRELCTKKNWPQPKISIIQKAHASAMNQFVAQCLIEGIRYYGMGTTRKDARQNAAIALINSLKEDDNFDYQVVDLSMVSDDVIEKPRIFEMFKERDMGYVAFKIYSSENFKPCVVVHLSPHEKQLFIGPVEGINNVFQQMVIYFNKRGYFPIAEYVSSESDLESF